MVKYQFPTADDLKYFTAIGLMIASQRGSTTFIQRNLLVSYSEAVAIMSRLEADGVVAKPNNVGKREVLIQMNEAAP